MTIKKESSDGMGPPLFPIALIVKNLEVEVALRIINHKKMGKGRQISDDSSFHKAALAQFNIVRIDFVWQSRALAGEVGGNYETNTLFQI